MLLNEVCITESKSEAPRREEVGVGAGVPLPRSVGYVLDSRPTVNLYLINFVASEIHRSETSLALAAGEGARAP